ncbi:MAG: hypothetical protein R2713_24215, partial [Ilumatobacteraceae bacterium]
RWVVFEGAPTDGSDRTSTIWLRDTSVFGAPDAELTPLRSEFVAGDSVRPAISGDGCVVAFVTEIAYDLFRDDDTGARWDVYRTVLPACEDGAADGGAAGGAGAGVDDTSDAAGGALTGTMELVSTQSSADGDTRALDRVDPNDAPALSQAGTVVAFTHQAHEGKDPLLAVTVADLAAPLGNPLRTALVAGTPLLPPNTTFRHLGQRQPGLSDDRRFVARLHQRHGVRRGGARPGAGQSAACSAGASRNVRVGPIRDRPCLAVTVVSALDELPAEWGAESPAISGNGQFVAFQSPSPELAGGAALPDCGGICPPQVYRHDQVGGARWSWSATRSPTPTSRRWQPTPVGAAHHLSTTAPRSVSSPGRRNLFLVSSRRAPARPTVTSS